MRFNQLYTKTSLPHFWLVLFVVSHKAVTTFLPVDKILWLPLKNDQQAVCLKFLYKNQIGLLTHI